MITTTQMSPQTPFEVPTTSLISQKQKQTREVMHHQEPGDHTRHRGVRGTKAGRGGRKRPWQSPRCTVRLASPLPGSRQAPFLPTGFQVFPPWLTCSWGEGVQTFEISYWHLAHSILCMADHVSSVVPETWVQTPAKLLTCCVALGK